MRWRQRSSVLAGLEVLRRTHPEITLNGVIIFLYVAENPGINVAELAEVIGGTEATASRVARRLAGPEIERPLAPSLGLLRITAQPGDHRSRHLDLSEAGETLRLKLDALIERAAPIRPWAMEHGAAAFTPP